MASWGPTQAHTSVTIQNRLRFRTSCGQGPRESLVVFGGSVVRHIKHALDKTALYHSLRRQRQTGFDRRLRTAWGGRKHANDVFKQERAWSITFEYPHKGFEEACNVCIPCSSRMRPPKNTLGMEVRQSQGQRRDHRPTRPILMVAVLPIVPYPGE